MIHTNIPASCEVTLPAGAKQVDRDLAMALRQLSQAPHAESECNDSVTGAALEVCFWIACSAVVWVVVALSI